MSIATLAQEEQWIRDRWHAQWSQPGVLVQWGNVPSPVPDGTTTPLVRISIANAAARQVAQPGHDRYDGVVIVEVMVAAQSGTATCNSLCDAVEAVFRRAGTLAVDGIQFWTPQTLPGQPHGAWYKRDVLCPFTRDTITNS